MLCGVLLSRYAASAVTFSSVHVKRIPGESSSRDAKHYTGASCTEKREGPRVGGTNARSPVNRALCNDRA